MNWYYAEAGQQVGPVAEDELLRLAESGRIRSDTLVWHEGMANWQPYAQVKSSPVAAPPVFSAPSGGALGADEVVCVECGKIVSQENAIAYGGNWVCATCKPRYIQKLQEGATLPVLPTEMPYAGFWIRFGAKMIDGFVLLIIIGIPMAILGVIIFARSGTRNANVLSTATGFNLGLQVSLNFVWYVGMVLYNWFFLARYGATLGKMACGLKVVTAMGAPLSVSQALGRSSAEILSQLTCDIGYLIAAFDGQKRALHDHIANTRVVFK